MYNDYPLYRTLPIQMTFTVEEWECILSSLELTIHDRCIGTEGAEELNIIDRIQKNLGIE